MHLDKVTVEQDTVRLQLMATAPTVACPCCAVSSSSVHSRYQRHLADLPWRTHAVHLQLTVRKFFCQNPRCARRIFTERLPALVAAYTRRTRQLLTALRAIGVALGGNAGARLAARLRLPTKPATLLRLVRTAPLPPTQALQAVGVDEWAWRRDHHYGTILVNLADHRVVELLPDRSAASVAAWLAQYPTVTVACRDRSPRMRMASARERLMPCRVWTASIWSRTSARPWKPSCSITALRFRRPRLVQRWRSRRPG